MDRCAAAYAYHKQGYNCAQSVAGAFADLTGTAPEQLMAAMGGFGGGVGGSHEELCGAVSGGVLVLSLLHPHTDGEDRAGKVRLYAQAKEFRIPCDYVIVAIGQAIQAKPFEAIGVTTRRGAIEADHTSSVPGVDNIFAGGDAVSGPATVIRAVAAGKVAAANIDNYLGFNHKISTDVEVPPAHMTNTPPCGRVNLRSRTLAHYAGDFSLVKEGMTEEEACQESSRCLRCDHFGFGSFKGGRNTEW